MSKPSLIRQVSAYVKYGFPVFLARALYGRPTPHPIPDLSQKKNLRFLTIKLDGAGDVILASPVFRLLREGFPDSSCVAVVKKRNRALLEHNPFVDQIFSPQEPSKNALLKVVPRALLEGWEIFRLYRKEFAHREFDVILYPRWHTDVYHGILLLTMVKAPVKISYTDTTTQSKMDFNRGLERSLTASLPPGIHTHEITRNLGPVKALLERSGRRRDDIPGVEIFVSNADREFARTVVSQIPPGKRPIAIAIGAQDIRRVWPMERWVMTLELLAAKGHNLYPMILCIASDRPRAQRLMDGLHGQAIILDNTSWTQAAAVLESVELILANDSGMGHVASAMKRRVVVVSPHPLFGFEPYGDNIRLLHPDAVLAPCSVQCSAPEPHCILQITPVQVADAAEEFLVPATKVCV